jgi:hypothetical protein
MKSANTNKTGNGEGKPLCTSTYLRLKKNFYKKIKKSTITDVEGRRLRE